MMISPVSTLFLQKLNRLLEQAVGTKKEPNQLGQAALERISSNAHL